jgi:antitoxin (DNA-binding transcriptional repressor) of toxin-antitoxin stability system
MKTITAAYLREHLSALLRRVQCGESFLILNCGQPVGRIEPIRPVGVGADADRMARLERAGILRPPVVTADWSPILKASPIRVSEGDSVLAALIEERRKRR